MVNLLSKLLASSYKLHNILLKSDTEADKGLKTIIFVKDTENNWTASVMIGYQENENLFIDENSMWEKGRNNQLILGVDTAALSNAK